MAQAVEEWYKQMPIITRSYLTAAIVTTIGCSLEIISPYNLYLNPRLVVKHYQFWRLVTNFLYFRKMDLDFLFHMFFLARYCKLLEENSFRGRTADFFYMLLFGATVLTGIVLIGGMIPYVSESFAKIIFLSNSLTFMMVYVWSKQNPFIHMSFLGLFTFTAAYLPWEGSDTDPIPNHVVSTNVMSGGHEYKDKNGESGKQSFKNGESGGPNCGCVLKSSATVGITYQLEVQMNNMYKKCLSRELLESVYYPYVCAEVPLLCIFTIGAL